MAGRPFKQLSNQDKIAIAHKWLTGARDEVGVANGGSSYSAGGPRNVTVTSTASSSSARAPDRVELEPQIGLYDAVGVPAATVATDDWEDWDHWKDWEPDDSNTGDGHAADEVASNGEPPDGHPAPSLFRYPLKASIRDNCLGLRLERVVNAWNNGTFTPPIGALEVFVWGPVPEDCKSLTGTVVYLVSHRIETDDALVYAHARPCPVLAWVPSGSLRVEPVYRFQVQLDFWDVGTKDLGLETQVVPPSKESGPNPLLLVTCIETGSVMEMFNAGQSSVRPRSRVMVGDLVTWVGTATNDVPTMKRQLDNWSNAPPGLQPLRFSFMRNFGTQMELTTLPSWYNRFKHRKYGHQLFGLLTHRADVVRFHYGENCGEDWLQEILEDTWRGGAA